MAGVCVGGRSHLRQSEIEPAFITTFPQEGTRGHEKRLSASEEGTSHGPEDLLLEVAPFLCVACVYARLHIWGGECVYDMHVCEDQRLTLSVFFDGFPLYI